MRRWFAIRSSVALTVALIVVVALWERPQAVEADGPDSSNLVAEFVGVPGFDISWPQCGKQYPYGPVAFSVIGINNGRPYTENPCFLDQYRWAQRVETRPAVYVNMEFPKPGRIEALSGPYGVCLETDDWCRAYNYGYGIAREVINRAAAYGVSPAMWWLDVETGNYWISDPIYNAQVIRGTLDYFKEKHLPVGIYGTPRQWRIIAGSSMPRTVVWTAGASGIDGAAVRCTNEYAFGGGPVVMVQYYDYGYDTNYICPGTEALFPHPQVHPIVDGPRGRGASAAFPLPFWRVVAMVGN